MAPAVTLVAKLPGSMYATDAMKAGPKAANAARARRRVGGAPRRRGTAPRSRRGSLVVPYSCAPLNAVCGHDAGLRVIGRLLWRGGTGITDRAEDRYRTDQARPRAVDQAISRARSAGERHLDARYVWRSPSARSVHLLDRRRGAIAFRAGDGSARAVHGPGRRATARRRTRAASRAPDRRAAPAQLEVARLSSARTPSPSSTPSGSASTRASSTARTSRAMRSR